MILAQKTRNRKSLVKEGDGSTEDKKWRSIGRDNKRRKDDAASFIYISCLGSDLAFQGRNATRCSRGSVQTSTRLCSLDEAESIDERFESRPVKEDWRIGRRKPQFLPALDVGKRGLIAAWPLRAFAM